MQLQRLVLLISFLTTVFASDIAVFWGQNSGGNQGRLADYCKSNDIGIVILSFLNTFPDPLQLNFANACEKVYTSDGILYCPTVGEDIKTCQDLGVKVLLSLGGATGSYGFTDDTTAEDFATTLWDLFGNGDSSEQRPLGDAVVDGFDLDIENKDQTGYVALAAKLRELYDTDSSKQYYLSAAPQCVYPDASLSNVLEETYLDYCFVQFYNNWCNLGANFNWNVWADYAKNTSPNKDVKVYIGLPGASGSANSGYLDASVVPTYVTDEILSNSNFGGISLWDASSSWVNYEDGLNYIQNMKYLVSGAVQTSAVSSIVPLSSSVLSATTVSSTSTKGSQSSTSSTSTKWYTPSTSSTALLETTTSASLEAAVSPVQAVVSPAASSGTVLVDGAFTSKTTAETSTPLTSSIILDTQTSVIAAVTSSTPIAAVTSSTPILDILPSIISTPTTTFNNGLYTTTSVPTSAPAATPYTYLVNTVVDGVTVVKTYTTSLMVTQYVTVAY